MSDEFSKTEQFQELYDNYKVELGKKHITDSVDKYIADSKKTDSELSAQWSDFSIENPIEYITTEIVKHGFSKSEAIGYFTDVSNELKDVLETYSDDKQFSLGTNDTKKVQDSIDLYDKITADLKDMWGFGNFDIKG